MTSVAAGVAQEGAAVPGDPNRQVIVLAERHDSRPVQVEIAIMLERLYGQGLRDLGLEGAVVQHHDPSASWFFKLCDPAVRADVALYLLKQGEIGGAEFTAMVHPDFRLHAIEDEAEYSVDLPPAAADALSTYLDALSKAPMTDEEYQGLVDLLQPLPKDGSAPPVEVMPAIIDGVVKAANDLGVDVGAAAQAIQEARAFYVAAAHRSVRMVNNTVALLRSAHRGLVALDVGDAHTRGIVDLLKAKSVSAAILSPASLPLDQQHGDLSAYAYDRKANSKPRSVDPAGTLGALLDGRHRPRPVLDEPWFEVKSAIMYAGVVLAQAAGGGGKPPYGLNRAKFGIGGGDPSGGPIDIDPRQIEVVPGTPIAIVPVHVPATHKTIWMAVRTVSPEFQAPDQSTLEEELLAVRKALLAEKVIDDPSAKAAESATDAAPVKMARDVEGIFGSSKESVLKGVAAGKLSG